jgi:hypothetical protein
LAHLKFRALLRRGLLSSILLERNAMKSVRKIRNFVLDPQLQLRFAGNVTMILALFAFAIVAYAQMAMHEIIDLLSQTPGLLVATIEELTSVISKFLGGFFAILAVFVVGTASFIIMQTHKIAGAKYAILRSIRSTTSHPNQPEKVSLRQADFLQDIATELNQLYDKIEGK